MMHDGNISFISDEIITDSLATYREYGSAVAAIPCVEAILRSKNGATSSDAIYGRSCIEHKHHIPIA